MTTLPPIHDAGPRATSRPHRLDADSRWAIRRFVIKLAVVGLFAGIVVKRPLIESMLVLAGVNILTSVALAVLYRESWDDGALNHWDEAMAFTGLCALAHALRFALGGGYAIFMSFL